MIYKINPVFKEYIWAGTKLKEKFNKNTELEKVSESFEFSVLKDNESTIIKDGKEIKITEVLDSLMLIKLIDADDNLSLQVHPSDDYAMKHYNKLGKTECWYIVDNKEGGFIYLGFNKDYSKEEVIKALDENRLPELLNKYYVKPGDFFFVESGTIHGIGAGVTLYEIQESSDLTFRLYDYNRVGKDGKPRELHIKESLDVLKYSKYEYKETKSSSLSDTKYFKLEKYKVDGEIELSFDVYSSITLIEGNVNFDSKEVLLGDSFLVEPSSKVKIKGNGTILVAKNK